MFNYYQAIKQKQEIEKLKKKEKEEKLWHEKKKSKQTLTKAFYPS
jgi:hypothetical protein